MSLTVVLAVGLDSWKLTAQSGVLKSAGYIVIAAHSIRDAIDHFRAGDFDLVLLDQSLSNEDRERLAFLIRATGSQTPVAFIADHLEGSLPSEDATWRDDSLGLLRSIAELLSKKVARQASTEVALNSAA